MDDLLKHGGNAIAILGITICAITGLARLFGAYYLFGFQTITLFDAGTTLLIAACVIKLQQLLSQKSTKLPE